jgi:hypothetical protein
MPEMDEEGLWELLDSLLRMVELDKKLIEKFSKHLQLFESIYNAEEIRAIRNILCIDLDVSKKKVEALKKQLVASDTEMAALFDLSVK